MNREEGQDLVEYALLVCLVALAAIGGVNKVASAITTVFTNISSPLGVTAGRITHPRDLSPFAGRIRYRLTAAACPALAKVEPHQKIKRS